MNETDRKIAVRNAILDYAHGWYEGSTTRMADALHPALAKRAWLGDANGSFALSEYPADKLVERVSRNTPETYLDKPRRADIERIDIVGNSASAILHMDQWTDLMHMVCIDGAWRIINVLWEPHTT